MAFTGHQRQCQSEFWIKRVFAGHGGFDQREGRREMWKEKNRIEGYFCVFNNVENLRF